MELSFLKNLCRLVEKPLLDGFSAPKSVNYKAGGEIVTSTDTLVHELLHNALLKAGYSEKQILSEEAADRSAAMHRNAFWIIDPIDGTREFAAGIPEFAVSIAYLEAGKITAGAIFNPANQTLVLGNADQGIQHEEAKIQEYGSSAVLVSKQEKHKGRFAACDREQTTVGVGSVAYRLALVASGNANATLSYEGKNSWDIAAGIFLVELSGGIATDIDGNRFDFSNPSQRFENGLIACGSSVEYKHLYPILQAAR